MSDLDPERLELIGKLLKLVEVAGPGSSIDDTAIIAEVRGMIDGCEGTLIEGIRGNVDQAEGELANGSGDGPETAEELLDVLRAAVDARRPTAELRAVRSELETRHSDAPENAEADELLREAAPS